MKNYKDHEFVGVDISKKFLDICFVDSKGQLVQQRINQNPEGYRTLASQINQDAIWIMEATGTYHLPLAHWLYDHGIKVVVENPLKIKRFSQMHLQRHKTDKADAKIIYNYGVTVLSKKIILWRPQSVHIQEIQQCDSLSQRLNKELTAITNTHEALGQLSFVNSEVKRIVIDTIKQLKTALKQLDKQMKKLIKEHYNETYNLLMSIPGVGSKTSVMLICQTNNFTRFENVKKFLSYIGMSPRTHESGTSIKGKGHITKMGNGRLRSLLYMCSWTAKRINPQCISVYKKMHQKGKPEKVIKVAIAHKLLRQVFGVIKSQQPFNLDLA
jgi:transposase